MGGRGFGEPDPDCEGNKENVPFPAANGAVSRSSRGGEVDVRYPAPSNTGIQLGSFGSGVGVEFK
jgi:hypothetical protein